MLKNPLISFSGRALAASYNQLEYAAICCYLFAQCEQIFLLDSNDADEPRVEFPMNPKITCSQNTSNGHIHSVTFVVLQPLTTISRACSNLSDK